LIQGTEKNHEDFGQDSHTSQNSHILNASQKHCSLSQLAWFCYTMSEYRATEYCTIVQYNYLPLRGILNGRYYVYFIYVSLLNPCLNGYNIKHVQKLLITVSNVVLETCFSSPIVPVEVVLSHKSAKEHLISFPS
jgi:hypothetical protein